MEIKNREDLVLFLESIIDNVETDKDTLFMGVIKGENDSIGHLNISTELSIQYQLNFKDSGEKQPLKISLHLKDFLNIIKFQETENLIFELKEDYLIIPNEFGYFHINYYKETTPLGFIDMSKSTIVEVDEEKLKDGILYVKNFQSETEIGDMKDNLCLNYIISVKNSELILLCTNRHILGRYKIKLDEPIDNVNLHYIIPKSTFNLLTAYSDQSNKVKLIFSGDQLLIKIDNLFILTKLQTFEFIFDDLLPKKVNFTISLDTESIKSIKRLFSLNNLTEWGTITSLDYSPKEDTLTICPFIKGQFKGYLTIPLPKQSNNKDLSLEFMSLYLKLMFSLLDVNKPSCKLIVNYEQRTLISFQKGKENTTKTSILMPVIPRE